LLSQLDESEIFNMCVDNLEISIPQEIVESSKPVTTATETVTDDTMMTDDCQSNFEIDSTDVHAHTEDMAITPIKETMQALTKRPRRGYRQHYLNSQSI
jgi:hypothetical protein